MAEIRETHTVFGPFPDVDPLDTARLFLRTNGYQIVEERRGPPPTELRVEPLAEDAVEGDVEEEDVAEEDVGEEDVGEEDVGEEDVGEEDVGEEDVGEEDVGEEDVGEEDVGEEDVGEEDVGEEDVGEEDVGEEDVGEEDVGQVVEMPDEVVTELVVERGKRGRGWFSSNLTELHTHVELRLEGNKVRMEYVVDTSGQHLWDEEKDFWKREAEALESFLVDQGGLRNMAENERERASEVRRDFVMMGFWIGAIVAILLFLALITLFRSA